jgi:8-oxo-dGTP diphosphatase
MSAADLPNLLDELDRDFLPHLSVNAVIFGAHAGALTVLLMKWEGSATWSLPGGYVRRDESVDDAAIRMIRERTGLSDTVLRQFHTFGGLHRGEAVVADALRAMGMEPAADHWVLGRVVSVGYVALVDSSRAQLAPDAWTQEHTWCDVTERPALILDHNAMVERALSTIRANLDALPLDESLLPGAFTMPELQRLYETVLGRPLDRRNFQKRMRELGLVERLPDQRIGVRRKPAYVYRWRTPDSVRQSSD